MSSFWRIKRPYEIFSLCSETNMGTKSLIISFPADKRNLTAVCAGAGRQNGDYYENQQII